MYYVRILFFLNQNYDLELMENKCLFENRGATCNMKVVKKMGKVFVILTYGGFITEEAAVSEGQKLLFNVKKSFVKKEIPINISGGLGVLDTPQTSFRTDTITQEGLEYFKSVLPGLENKTVEHAALGMTVYQLDQDISKVEFLMQEVEIKKTLKTPSITQDDYKDDDKILIAYSLLNSSNSINDLRARFILKVSTIEALVPEDQYKDENYNSVIKQLNKLITKDKIKLELTDAELEKLLESVKSSVGTLKKKSIGEKCTDLIRKSNIQDQYQGKDVLTFFKECYKLRSEFVHTGTFKNKVDETQQIRKLEDYSNDLNKLVLKILERYEMLL